MSSRELGTLTHYRFNTCDVKLSNARERVLELLFLLAEYIVYTNVQNVVCVRDSLRV